VAIASASAIAKKNPSQHPHDVFLPLTGGAPLKYTPNAYRSGDPKMAVDKWAVFFCPLIHSYYDGGDGGPSFRRLGGQLSNMVNNTQDLTCDYPAGW
jgi:hypothetical protein